MTSAASRLSAASIAANAVGSPMTSEHEPLNAQGCVREQAVSLIELFYDLVYVYAIAKMTSIFHGAELDPTAFAKCLITSFVVLRAWMYMTNYINR